MPWNCFLVDYAFHLFRVSLAGMVRRIFRVRRVRMAVKKRTYARGPQRKFQLYFRFLNFRCVPFSGRTMQTLNFLTFFYITKSTYYTYISCMYLSTVCTTLSSPSKHTGLTDMSHLNNHGWNISTVSLSSNFREGRIIFAIISI